VVGRTESFGAGSSDAWILNLGTDGSILWQKTIGASDYDFAFAATETNDGGLVFTGSTETTNGLDFWIVKLDSDENISWQKSYGGSDDDFVFSVQETVDGGFVTAGETRSFNSTMNSISPSSETSNSKVLAVPTPGITTMDAWIFKLDENGEINSCNLMNNTNTVISDSAALVVDTNISGQDFNPTVTDTLVTPQDTMATSNFLCLFQPTLTPTSSPTITSTRTETPTATNTEAPGPSPPLVYRNYLPLIQIP
jgi:hypothetical protein